MERTKEEGSSTVDTNLAGHSTVLKVLLRCCFTAQDVSEMMARSPDEPLEPKMEEQTLGLAQLTSAL